jgi:hypothetical protein
MADKSEWRFFSKPVDILALMLYTNKRMLPSQKIKMAA